MGQIGDIVFAQVTGPSIPEPSISPEVVTRPGVDGHAVRAQAARAEPVEWQTVEWCADAFAAANAQVRYDLLKGLSVLGGVTCTDDFGRFVNNCTILAVQVVRVSPLAAAYPPATRMVRARWMILKTLID